MKLMKKYLTMILLVLIVIFGYILTKMIEKEQLVVDQQPLYYFYYIGKNDTDPYWASIEDGIEDAAVDYKVAVEYASPKFTDFESHYKRLDVAILSKADGVITYGYTDDKFTELIDHAVANGLPIVTVESDNKESMRHAFIGTSSYRLGEEAADLLVEATAGQGKVLLIRKYSKSGNSLDETLRIDGFVNQLSAHLGLEIIDMEVDIDQAQTLDSVIGQAIQAYPEIEAIYTPNSVDTIVAAKYIVNKNLVGRVVVIGIGNSKEAIHYIKRGIIFGTVMSDPYLMGYKSIEMLIQVSENQDITVVSDTGLKINTYESVLAEEADDQRQE